MVDFRSYRLENGLRLIVHEDRSTPLVAMNILYDAGSRDEDPALTGMAHLVEHLMYCGTGNIPEYDLPLQLAGGENNAFTSNDITNYYITLPSANVETAFWLESDRMLAPGFTDRKLEIQKSVVIEEFRQRYLNQPYGDAMLLLRPLAYKIHPYRWPTIGIEPAHIERTGLEDVRRFFGRHYNPGKAILTLSGNITPARAYELALKWFGSIPAGEQHARNLPPEQEQKEERRLTAERDLPADALYKAWHMGPRSGPDFHTMDVITDLLAGGESGRLYNKLVRDLNLFSEINAFITSDLDPGLVIITGKIMKGVDIDKAEKAVDQVIQDLMETYPSDYELDKVRNRYESSSVLSNTSILNKALSLSFFELLGDASAINFEVEAYRAVSKSMIRDAANRYLNPANCSTLCYLATKNKGK
jgi:predicted Zn-dependent peptidase